MSITPLYLSTKIPNYTDYAGVPTSGRLTNSLYLTVNHNRDLYEKLFLANAVKSATTKSPSWDIPDPKGDNSWYIMTHQEGKIQLVIAQL